MDEPQFSHPSPQSYQAQQPPHHPKHDEQFLSLSRQVSDLLSRLRLLEERYANLRREHQTTGQNMIENHQHLSKQQRRFSDTIVDLKRSLNDLNEQLGIMRGELSDAAGSHELKALDRYLDFWQPINFITRAEADRLIRQAAEEQARKFYKGQEGR